MRPAGARRGTSEADVILTAIADAVRRPWPRAGIWDGEPFGGCAEELLAGFADT